jgi:hypothetical protein
MIERFASDYTSDLSDIFRDCEGVRTVAVILERLAARAGQENFREAMRSEIESPRETPTGDAINIIPHGVSGSCKELLMIFSTGRNLFDTRLREAHDHCAAACPGITKGVLLVTDFWDNEKFWDTRASTYEKLAAKYGLVLAAAIWTGKRFTLEQIIP